MIGDSSLEPVRKAFATQFQPDGDGYIYRQSMKGAPKRVDAEEFQGFVDAYNRNLRKAWWGFVVAMIAIFALCIVIPFTGAGNDVDFPVAPLYVGLGLITAVFQGSTMWEYRAPARELSMRVAVGEAMSRDEARRTALARISYGQLAGAVGMAGFLLLRIGLRSGWLSLLIGWNRLWLVFAAGITVASAFQAYRKWRCDTLQKRSGSGAG